jgi:hypothetical protein
MSEQVRQVGPGAYLIAEDKIAIASILYSSIGFTPRNLVEARRLGEYVYYTFIANINGVKIEGGNYDPKKVPEKIDEIIDRLSKRTKALSVIRSPTVAEGLVNEAIEDIAMLIALLRAMVLEIKASIVKA